MPRLNRVVKALEARNAPVLPPEVKAADLLPLLEAIKAISNLAPVLEAINAIKIPEPKEADLTPVMDAINAKNVDLTPLLEAIRAIKMPEMPVIEEKPTKWVFTHERNYQGLIVKTEAEAVGRR